MFGAEECRLIGPAATDDELLAMIAYCEEIRPWDEREVLTVEANL